MPTNITLTPEQAAYLEANKMVAVVLPMEPQPPEGFRSATSSPDCDGKWWFTNAPRKSMPVNELGDYGHFFPKLPFTPGDRVECYKYFETDNAYGVKGSIILTVTTCEPIEVAKITEEQAERCGVGPESPRHIYNPYPPELDLYSAPAFIRHWQSTHPGKTHGWYVEMKKGGE